MRGRHVARTAGDVTAGLVLPIDVNQSDWLCTLRIPLHTPGAQRDELIDDFGLRTADYLRERAVFMEATTMERISFASFFRSVKRFSFINPASAISSIQ